MSIKAGYVFFFCDSCEKFWKEKTRDIESGSSMYCDCGEMGDFMQAEHRPEWKKDMSGNLIAPNDYEGQEDV